MNMFMILYTYTVLYLCPNVCKGRRQAVHLINEKECLKLLINVPPFVRKNLNN